MKKAWTAILIILTIVLCGCVPKSHTACLNQSLETVSKIELYGTKDDKHILLYTLKESEVDVFWSELEELGFHRYHNDPATEYGALSVKIYYSNGYTDIIGTEINGYYSPTGESVPVGWYYLADRNDFDILFGRYIENFMLPRTE